MNFSGISRETVFGRALRFPLRIIPSETKVRILQGPLRGTRWIAGSSNHGCWLGSYEYPKQKAFSATVKPGDCVYDVGAHAGLYTLLASALAGPKGTVASFEPSPRNLELLRKHLQINAISNCAVWNAAVGGSDGVADFDAGPFHTDGRLAATGTIKVRVVTLDKFVAEGLLRPPNVIKCDIEGGELDALKGARSLLEKHRPTLFLATHGLEVHRECCKLLSHLHYKLAPLDERPLEESQEIVATPISVASHVLI